MSVKHAFVGYGGIAGWHHENIKHRVPEIQLIMLPFVKTQKSRF